MPEISYTLLPGRGRRSSLTQKQKVNLNKVAKLAPPRLSFEVVQGFLGPRGYGQSVQTRIVIRDGQIGVVGIVSRATCYFGEDKTVRRLALRIAKSVFGSKLKL